MRLRSPKAIPVRKWPGFASLTTSANCGHDTDSCHRSKRPGMTVCIPYVFTHEFSLAGQGRAAGQGRPYRHCSVAAAMVSSSSSRLIMATWDQIHRALTKQFRLDRSVPTTVTKQKTHNRIDLGVLVGFRLADVHRHLTAAAAAPHRQQCAQAPRRRGRRDLLHLGHFALADHDTVAHGEPLVVHRVPTDLRVRLTGCPADTTALPACFNDGICPRDFTVPMSQTRPDLCHVCHDPGHKRRNCPMLLVCADSGVNVALRGATTTCATITTADRHHPLGQ